MLATIGRPAPLVNVEKSVGGKTSHLVWYLVAAALVRGASGGAAVGLVTAAIAHGVGAGAGGLLAALLTAPHLLGPLLARQLDRAPDGRAVLATAFALFGVALASGALLLGRAPIVMVAVLIGVAGLCGPLLTGGLSSRLAAIAGPVTRAQRRAEGWDSATYGLGSTAGPALVAAAAAVTSPVAAVVVLGAFGVVAGALVLTLPRTPSRATDAPAMRVREAFHVMLTVGPLRRVLVATALSALGSGGLMVLAVIFGTQLGSGGSAGAALGAAYGFGNLAGSLAAAVFPLRGESERLTLVLVAITGAAIALCAAAPGYAVAVGTFALAGAANAVLFTASLAVRSTYSPPRARAQVFVSMAGIKMSAASASTALVGALIGQGPRVLLVAAAVVTLLAAAIALADRRTASTPSPVGESVG